MGIKTQTQKLNLTPAAVTAMIANAPAKSGVGIDTPFAQATQHATFYACFFVSAVYRVWWAVLGDLRVGRSCDGSVNPVQFTTNRLTPLVVSFDNLITGGHYD